MCRVVLWSHGERWATILGFSRHVAQRGGREDLFGLVLQSLGGFSGLMPVKLP